MGRLIGPLLVVGWVFFVHLTSPDLGVAVESVSRVAGILLATAAVLASYFRRGRLAAMAVLAAVWWWLPEVTLTLGDVAGDALRSAILFWIACDFLGLVLGNEWRVLGLAGSWRGLVLALQLGSAWWLARQVDQGLAWGARAQGWLEQPWGHDALVWGSSWSLAWPALGLFTLAIAASLWRVRQQPSPFAIAQLTATGLLTLGAGWSPAENAPSVAWAILAVGLVLVVGLLAGAYSLAFEDGLTRLPARRALEEQLASLGRTYALAMVDIDHFKKLNDRHGHEVGDQVLRMVAAMLAKTRGGGQAFRYGGEEFTVVFTGKSAEAAEPYLDTLRQAIAKRRFEVRSPNRPQRKPKDRSLFPSRTTRKSLRVTVSIGVADRGRERARPEEVLKKADKALYRSKRGGRNRVTRIS